MKSPEQFLHQKDSSLHTSGPVEHEKKRKDMAGEKTSQKPADKIADWLKVVERTHTSHREDPQIQDRIKEYYHKEYIINEEDIPQGYYDNQSRLARELGHGDIEISEDTKKELAEIIIADQKSTLDTWTDYFTSEDSDSYPMWAKYWSFTSMVKMSSYDKEEHKFGRRDKGTVAPFPDLDREALAHVVDAMIKKVGKENLTNEIQDEEFEKLLGGANFGKLYAYAIEQVTPAEKAELESTEGEWIKYNKGSDHMPLVQSLQGHGTGWCTAGESTAENQLKSGDFYVYYSYDKDGKPTIPRTAIRMQGDNIGEIRGIAKEQNLDHFIGDVVDEKLEEFGTEGEVYQKKSTDMKKLTEIDNMVKSGQELGKEDLRFLYEIDNTIEGFGYQRDPRIAEILQSRNPKEDAPIVFDCQPSEIAWDVNEVNENTKAYIGAWNVDVFNIIQNYPNIEHLYESFPDKKIFMQSLETDSEIDSLQAATQALKDKNMYLSNYGKDILKQAEFSQEQETYDLVRFTVEELGFPDGATTYEIYTKAEELGLELCPAEVGPQLRLQNTSKEWMLIAMKQITGRYGGPRVFDLDHFGDQPRLHAGNAKSDERWFSNDRFVFRFRKLKT
jgi:hypothetical protein